MKKRLLLEQERIQKRVRELAEEINTSYGDEKLIIVPILRGGFMFSADLIRHLRMPVEIDFLTTSSYGNATVTSGDVQIYSDVRSNLKGNHVLVVDDIIDSGKTIAHVKDHILSKEPKSLKFCTLLDKPSRRRVEISSDFVGFTIDDLFIVGYGLDYQGLYRNIPYIFVFEEDKE
ncbi:MAG: hypoxanthine phosphoribosyltransferase [Tissierellia bacterium]|nr:hypoxanthine phosphoribosyltransferase [Tissierellia bacterium]